MRKLLLCVGLVLSAGQAAAQECRLTKVTSYDLVLDDRGRPTISFTVADKNLPMLVDTASPLSTLSDETAKSLSLPRTAMRSIRTYDGRSNVPPFDADGNRYRFLATAPTIAIGSVTNKNADFVIAPGSDFGASNAGAVGFDVLRNFDLDFDFANRRLNLFLPEHCPGQAVYWTREGVTQVPFRLDMVGRPQFYSTLDKNDVETVLDTGSAVSHISEPVALETFNVDRLSSGTEPATEGGKPSFRHRFSTLSVGGVTISNPTLYLRPDDLARRMHQDAQSPLRDPSGGIPHVPQLTLGMSELKALHIFVSSKERLIYITAADAK